MELVRDADRDAEREEAHESDRETFKASEERSHRSCVSCAILAWARSWSVIDVRGLGAAEVGRLPTNEARHEGGRS